MFYCKTYLTKVNEGVLTFGLWLTLSVALTQCVNATERVRRGWKFEYAACITVTVVMRKRSQFLKYIE